MNFLASVLILTKDEENDVGACLDSVICSDDVHVFDSYSNDKTVDVAKQKGANVTQRFFDDYASQRNAALRQIKFKYKWVLMLDADERLPGALAGEIATFLADPPNQVAACRIPRKDYFMGKWMKHAPISPFGIRLFQPDKVHYERNINEVIRVEGRILNLKNYFEHYPFSKGIAHWLSKHNLYSSMEAKFIVDGKANVNSNSLLKALFSKNVNERRFHQKELFYRLPFRPFLKWCYMMFVRGAFLDGRAGITYSFLQSIYEYMIILKTRELRNSK